MPLFMAPKPEANTDTKDCTPDKWETDGPKREYFRILRYLDPSVYKSAQKAARETTVNGNGRSAEGVNTAAYYHVLFTAQLKGWRLLVAPGVPADPETMEEDGGYLFWQFTPKNVADLPWDIAEWLDSQIQLCGGGLPTSSLVTVADDGTLLTFRGTPQGVAAG